MFRARLRENVQEPSRHRLLPGFTLVEMLVVLAVIGIMTAMIVSSISNASNDARMVIARQQQAVVQEALNAWVASQAIGTPGLSVARSNFTAAGTTLQKLALMSNYFSSNTYANLSRSNATSGIQTAEMEKLGVSLQFSTWTTSNYPWVSMQ
jgi:prepilin-type N-terminal cleavage/methylation domain-containing protein